MFDNLRRAFREAVDNFNRELERDAVPETVDKLIRGMEQEAVSAKASTEALKKDLEKVRKVAAAEERNAEVCRRREKLARDIGDEETAEIAATFGEKHERRHRVLARKAEAIEAEVRLMKSEYDGMLDQIRKARTSRSSLSATAGRTQARRSVREGEALFDEMDRMEEKIDGFAPDEASRDDDGSAFDEELGRSHRQERIDARLTELKRRMGRR